MRTLVILLCQDRELNVTREAMKANLLEPLNADLALFGTRSAASDEVTYRFDWSRPEPDDWLATVTQAGLDEASLTKLASLCSRFLGGTSLPGTEGSGAIILWWRYQLGLLMRQQLSTLPYDWFAITRSDFLWLAPHPPVENLDPATIYFMDGERYGGVSDRHALFHRTHAEKMFAACDELFTNPDAVFDRVSPIRNVNPERFLLAEWRALGVMQRVFFLPYLAFAVRSADGTSRWTMGEWDEQLQLFVKYPAERLQASAYAKLIHTGAQWGRFPARPNWRVGFAWGRLSFSTAARGMLALVRSGVRRIRARR